MVSSSYQLNASAKTLAPWAGDYWGNGGQWAASAAAAGFRGSQPQVGAIAYWNGGGYGHMLEVVTAVQSATSISF